MSTPAPFPDAPLIGPVSPPDIHVLTLNIRRRVAVLGSRRVDRWSARAPALETLLRAEQATLLGLQEVLPGQARFLGKALGPHYGRLGHGREADGRGEGCPIFYDRRRLRVLEWDQLALSDTPGVAGSRSWGNMTPRTLVSAVMQDRNSGRTFLAVNTHFDHRSRRSRVRAADQVRDHVSQHALPAVVTGDFNSGEDTEPLRQAFTGGVLLDSWETATRRLTPEWGTFTNYRPPATGRKRIDWILTTPDVEVIRIGMNARRPRDVWPSDHLAVQAVIRIPENHSPAHD